jgi:hypothetical protein
MHVDMGQGGNSKGTGEVAAEVHFAAHDGKRRLPECRWSSEDLALLVGVFSMCEALATVKN